MDDWYQQMLTPPEVLEVNVRIGVIPSTDHVQALAEIKDPVTGVLLGQTSWPSAKMRDLPQVIQWAADKARLMLEDAVEPF